MPNSSLADSLPLHIYIRNIHTFTAFVLAIIIRIRIVPLVAEYTDPASTDITPQTEDTNTMLPTDEAFRRGCESWLKW
jgi:hypothetical protein